MKTAALSSPVSPSHSTAVAVILLGINLSLVSSVPYNFFIGSMAPKAGTVRPSEPAASRGQASASDLKAPVEALAELHA